VTAVPPAGKATAGEPRFRTLWLLAAVCAVAVVARLFHLGSGYWIDEILALRDSFRGPLREVLTQFPGDHHHPLYAVVGRISVALLGESPWTVRLPAAVAGAASVPLVYALSARLAGRTEALLAGLLLAVSFHHVWFSQNARGYTLMALLALASTLVLLKALETPAIGLFVLYAILASLGAYTHLTMVFVAVGHAVTAAIAVLWPVRHGSSPGWRGPLLGFTLAAVFTLALYAPVLGQVLDFFLNNPSNLEGTSTPTWALREAVRVLLLGVSAGTALLGGFILIAGAAVGLLGLGSIWRRDRNAAMAYTLPGITMLAGALVSRGTMYPRFFFFMSGIVVIVALRGCYAAAEWIAARVNGSAVLGPRLASGGALMLVLASAASLTLNYRYPKQDFEGALRFVEANRGPTERVGFTGVPFDPYAVIMGVSVPMLRTAADVEALRTGGRSWLIYTFPRYLTHDSPEVAAIVEHECHQRAVFPGTVGGGDVIVCTLEPT